MRFYPLCNFLPETELQRLGAGSRQNVHAINTGKKRPPLKGEWFLSGAIVGAYRAEEDMSIPYSIAKLVRTETTIKQVV